MHCIHMNLPTQIPSRGISHLLIHMFRHISWKCKRISSQIAHYSNKHDGFEWSPKWGYWKHCIYWEIIKLLLYQNQSLAPSPKMREAPGPLRDLNMCTVVTASFWVILRREIQSIEDSASFAEKGWVFLWNNFICLLPWNTDSIILKKD